MPMKRTLIALAALASFLMLPRTASATSLSIYQVTVDTSALARQGLFSADFVFTDGSELNDPSRLVTLLNFHLGGGAGVSISDDSVFNERPSLAHTPWPRCS